MKRLLLLACMGVAVSTSGLLHAASDPKSELAGYSQIDIDLEALYSGAIQVGRGVPLSSARGMCTEAVYVAHRPLDFTARFLINWDPSSHPETCTYLSYNFHDLSDAKFEEFKFTRTDRPTQLLMEYTLAIQNNRDELYLTSKEVSALQKKMSALTETELDRPPFQQAAREFWSGVLRDRFSLYQQGGVAALPPIVIDGKRYSVSEELRSMFKDSPAISKRFADLLGSTCLGTTTSAPIAPDLYYWQMFKADTVATVCLGGIYSKPMPESVRILDFQFYVSNSYLTSVTVYELFPVQVKGHEATLIWRRDYVAAPAFAALRGVEQMAAGMLMSQNIKQAVQFFIEDINKAPQK